MIIPIIFAGIGRRCTERPDRRFAGQDDALTVERFQTVQLDFRQIKRRSWS